MSGKSYREAVLMAADMLNEYGVDNPKYDSQELLMKAADMDYTQYLLHCEEMIDDKLYAEFEKLIRRRAAREPLQHIIGYTYFWGRKYVVNENVLIPRQDTEILVEKALQCIHTGDKVLDMCTGSGCIIITLASERQLSKAVGVDVSKKALDVAKVNADNHLADVEFIESDLFENVFYSDKFNSKAKSQHTALYDVIVSNPPYIEQDVIDTLSDEVKRFDPLIALDGGKDGLIFYRKITRQSVNYLKSGGWLLYEIGSNQSQQVKDIMMENGYEDISIVRDLAGLCRVVIGRLK